MDFSGVQSGAWSLVGGAIAAVVSGLFAWLIAYQNFGRKLEELSVDLQQKRQLSASNALVERTFRQLNEFYGPLMANRAASEGIWCKLRTVYNRKHGKADDAHFRLVDQLPTIVLDPLFKSYVDEIFRLAELAERLLLEKGALVEGPWPESFSRYLAHTSLMRAARAGGNPHPGQEGSMADSSMPKRQGSDIDEDIKIGHSLLMKKLGNIESLGQ